MKIELDFDTEEVRTLRQAYENAAAAMSDGHSMPFVIRDLVRTIEDQVQPEEPSGLGAVVKDSDHVVWVRAILARQRGLKAWRAAAVGDRPLVTYEKIGHVVEVLSEGWKQSPV